MVRRWWLQPQSDVPVVGAARERGGSRRSCPCKDLFLSGKEIFPSSCLDNLLSGERPGPVSTATPACWKEKGPLGLSLGPTSPSWDILCAPEKLSLLAGEKGGHRAAPTGGRWDVKSQCDSGAECPGGSRRWASGAQEGGELRVLGVRAEP